MNFGGIIAGAIGGAASGALESNRAAQAQETAIAAERRQSQLRREDAIFEMDLKLKAQAKQDERYVRQSDQIKTRSEQIGSERDTRNMTAGKAGLVDEGEFAGQAIDPAEIANLPPAARAAYESSGMLTKRTGSSIINDQISAAREIGAGKELRGELTDSYGRQVTAERNQVKDDLAQSKEERNILKDDRRYETDNRKIDQRDRQYGIDNARDSRKLDIYEKRGGNGQEGGSKFTNAITSAQRVYDNSVEKRAKAFREPTMDERMRPASVALYADEKKKYMEADPKLNDQRDRLENLMQLEARDLFSGLGSDKPKPSPQSGPIKVSSNADYEKLASGTRFTAPDGSIRIKP
jgi:hypothetical protein